MTTIEGNKLIGIFDGWYQKDLPKNGDLNWFHDKYSTKITDSASIPTNPENFKYHSSWDWQIPAWIKLLSITRERYYNEIKSGRSTSWSDQWDVWESNYHSAIDSGLPKNGFDILVLAIQWYNENKIK